MRPDPSLGLRGTRSTEGRKPSNRNDQDKAPSWQDIAKLQQKITELQAKQPKQVPGEGGPENAESQAPTEDEYKRVCSDLKRLRASGDAGFLGRFGIDHHIEQLEVQKAQLEKGKREQKQPNERLEQAQNYEKLLLADIAKQDARAKELGKQREDLERDIADHARKVETLQQKLRGHRAEIADILADLARVKAPVPPRAAGGGRPEGHGGLRPRVRRAPRAAGRGAPGGP